VPKQRARAATAPAPPPALAGTEKACFLPPEEKHAFSRGDIERQLRGRPCACAPLDLGWISTINPCNVYLVDRSRDGAPIVRAYIVILPRRKKQPRRRRGAYTKADPCL
jgi:hypothetical protein